MGKHDKNYHEQQRQKSRGCLAGKEKHMQGEEQRPLGMGERNSHSYQGQGTAPERNSSFGGTTDTVLKRLDTLDLNLADLQNAVGYGLEGEAKSLFQAIRNLRSDVRNVRGVLRANGLSENAPLLSNLLNDIFSAVSRLQGSLQGLATDRHLDDAKAYLHRDINSQSSTMRLELKNAIQKDLDGLRGTLGRVQTAQQQLSDFAEGGFQQALKAELKPLRTPLETMTGKVEGVAADIADVTTLLKDKGLVMRQKFPAATTDEEVLCQLTEYGQAILEKLSTAARWYARKQPELEQIDQLRADAEKAHDIGYNEGREAGQREGKRAIVRELVKKFGDCAALMCEAPGELDGQTRLQIVADLLQANGVQRELAPGQVVTVTEENVRALSTQIEDLPGDLPQDIRIVTGDYYLEEELLQKATWAPVTSELVPQETPAPPEEPAPKEAPEPMAEPAPQEAPEPMAEPAPQETPEPLAGAEPPQSPASASGFPRQD
ncbi:MAG: hypothetical protein MR711_05430 [Selenomonas sp.]|uniref:hypothetical protein n=1 Tax=Selenomonas sp. TaxID=2053611 RepID=UPI0025E275FB|nr:hypothetical protein [Selenomonas sp.]MCI6085682.1 hypothetical protein [Selenomonas sp.]MDY4416785.1 hypothetical protein [Selenomonas sp.]